MMDNVKIFCDGSANNHIKKGSWGLVMLDSRDTPARFLYPATAYDGVTSNQMEMMAAIYATRLAIKAQRNTKIFSDSKYVVLGVNERLINWANNGWRIRTGEPVANLRLWQHLHASIEAMKSSDISIKFSWMKGHQGDDGYWNEVADRLACYKTPTTDKDKYVNELKEQHGYSQI